MIERCPCMKILFPSIFDHSNAFRTKLPLSTLKKNVYLQILNHFNASKNSTDRTTQKRQSSIIHYIKLKVCSFQYISPDHQKCIFFTLNTYQATFTCKSFRYDCRNWKRDAWTPDATGFHKDRQIRMLK